MQNNFSPKSSAGFPCFPKAAENTFEGQVALVVKILLLEIPSVALCEAAYTSVVPRAEIKLWGALSLQFSSPFPKHAGCGWGILVSWALAAKNYAVQETEAEIETFVWESLVYHLGFSSLGWGIWPISHEMPALTTPHAFPTAERHKTCTTQFGEPREEEVQQYTEIVSSGTQLSKRGWKWFKTVTLSAWASWWWLPWEPLITLSLSLPGIQIKQHPLLGVGPAVLG